MCGRFCIAASPGEIMERYEVTVPAEYQPRYNVSPGTKILAISKNQETNEANMHEWGITAELPNRIINARVETVRDKPLFKRSFENHRCLIPISGYFEWKHNRSLKTPYFFSSKEYSLISLAGLIRPSSEGNQVVILTTLAVSPSSDIHERMPVILNPASETDFLTEGSIVMIEKSLDLYEVSSKVNQVSVDDPELIRPVNHRTGQMTLGYE